MTRTRAIARILACQAHAEADTPEGRVAAGIAERLRSRYHVTDADLAIAALEAAGVHRLRAELPADWGVPWLVALAAAVSQHFGVELGIAPGPSLALIGPGAGRAHRLALAVRRRAEARAASVGDVCRLPCSRAHGGTMWTTTAATTSGWFVGGFAPQTMGQRFGPAALDAYRLTVAIRMLDREPAAKPAAQPVRARAPVDAPAASPGPVQGPESGPTPPPPPLPLPPPPPPRAPIPEIEAIARQAANLLRVCVQVAEGGADWLVEPVTPSTAIAC